MRPAQIAPGDVLSYDELCRVESARLQRGMNFRLRGGLSVVLMSVQPNAPYADSLEDGGRTLIYEGHNAPLSPDNPRPDECDQPAHLPSGRLTQNGLFYEATERFKCGEVAELVKVYEKMKPGIWVFNGTFRLTDAWQAEQNGRKVWKFRLELVDEAPAQNPRLASANEPSRVVPSHIKLEVWRRDGGKCAKCASGSDLHFDHILPFAKGGTSENVANIQLLCQACNLAKSDRIE